MKLSEHIIRVIDLFYVKPLEKVLPRETFRYAVCGAANMLLGWVVYSLVFSYMVRDRFLDLGFVVMSPHIQSLFIQFPVTFFTGFWLNRYVTFRQSPLRGRVQLFRYALSVVGSLLLNYALLKLLVEVAGIYPTIAKPIVDAGVVVYSYCMAKFFTFQGSKD